MLDVIVEGKAGLIRYRLKFEVQVPILIGRDVVFDYVSNTLRCPLIEPAYVFCEK